MLISARVIGAKIQLIGWSTYSVAIWSLKAAWLFFYIRLFSGLQRNYRVPIYVGFGLVIATWLTLFLTIFCECVPFHRNWQIYPDPGSMCFLQVPTSVCPIYTSMPSVSKPQGGIINKNTRFGHQIPATRHRRSFSFGSQSQRMSPPTST